MSKNLMFVSVAALPAFGASLTKNGGFEPPVATNACFTFDDVAQAVSAGTRGTE